MFLLSYCQLLVQSHQYKLTPRLPKLQEVEAFIMQTPLSLPKFEVQNVEKSRIHGKIEHKYYILQ